MKNSKTLFEHRTTAPFTVLARQRVGASARLFEKSPRPNTPNVLTFGFCKKLPTYPLTHFGHLGFRLRNSYS
jgi:hypothetical protein